MLVICLLLSPDPFPLHRPSLFCFLSRANLFVKALSCPLFLVKYVLYIIYGHVPRTCACIFNPRPHGDELNPPVNPLPILPTVVFNFGRNNLLFQLLPAPTFLTFSECFFGASCRCKLQ